MILVQEYDKSEEEKVREKLQSPPAKTTPLAMRTQPSSGKVV
jgi:hypothetical protein